MHSLFQALPDAREHVDIGLRVIGREQLVQQLYGRFLGKVPLPEHPLLVLAKGRDDNFARMRLHSQAPQSRIFECLHRRNLVRAQGNGWRSLDRPSGSRT